MRLGEINLFERCRRSRTVLPRKVMTHINRDAIEPGAKILAGAKLREVSKNAQVNFLSSLSRIVAIPQHSPGNRDYALLSRQHDALEGEPISRAHLGDEQREIVCRLFFADLGYF